MMKGTLAKQIAKTFSRLNAAVMFIFRLMSIVACRIAQMLSDVFSINCILACTNCSHYVKTVIVFDLF